MNWFCTLFDSGYLHQGLALYRSLEAAGKDFRLVIYCMDDLALQILSRLHLERAELIPASEFETADLLSVKNSRSRVEYCWTCTPFTILDSLKRFSLSEATYLDADLFFYASPSVLLDEFHQANASILLTEHRFSPQYDQRNTSGIYCVQFMSFTSDERGMRALHWWSERCLEWCYDRHEDGKFGDQKYLDDWKDRFEGVHILRHLGGGVAPWNIQQYRVSPGPKVNGDPLIFYHFHRFRIYRHSYDLCDSPYELSPDSKEQIYRPYIKAIQSARRELPELESRLRLRPRGFISELRRLKHRLRGLDHVVS